MFLFIVLLVNVSPQVGWEDSGELGSSSFLLSISHPPGFPLYSLFLKSFFFLPLGSIAYRSNIGSAFLGALCLYLLYSTLRSLNISSRWCIIALFFLLTTPQFLLHAATCEIYMLFLFLIALAIWFQVQFIHYAPHKNSRFFYICLFLSGLCSSLNPVFMVFFVPVLAGFLIAAPKPAVNGRRRYDRMIFFLRTHAVLSSILFLLGFSVSLYLVIRGTRADYFYWGPLLTVTDYVNHSTAFSYRSGFSELQLFPSFIVLHERLLLLLSTVKESALLYLWPFIIIGLLSIRKNKITELSLFAVLLLDSGYTLLINPMGIQSLQTSLVSLYCLALFTACGLEELSRKLLKR